MKENSGKWSRWQSVYPPLQQSSGNQWKRPVRFTTSQNAHLYVVGLAYKAPCWIMLHCSKTEARFNCFWLRDLHGGLIKTNDVFFHWLFSSRSMDYSLRNGRQCRDAMLKTMWIQILGSVPLTRSAPNANVNGVCSGLRHILHPALVEICSVVVV